MVTMQRNECSAVGLPMARYFWQAHQYSWPIDCWRRISIPTIDQLRRWRDSGQSHSVKLPSLAPVTPRTTAPSSIAIGVPAISVRTSVSHVWFHICVTFSDRHYDSSIYIYIAYFSLENSCNRPAADSVDWNFRKGKKNIYPIPSGSRILNLYCELSGHWCFFVLVSPFILYFSGYVC